MSYRNERKQQLSRQLASRRKDLASVAKLKDKDGKPRSPKDIARISRAIQVDVSYMQKELAALDEPGTGLAARASVGRPLGKVCLLPFHEAVDRWYQGRRLMGG